MFNICRLCLCTSNDLNEELFVNVELLRKISLYLHVDFVINDSLPKQVCTCCLDKLEEILQFHEKVKSNQQLLISYLELGEESLTSFYCSLDANIKEEKKVFEELDAAELTCETNESNYPVENDYSSDDNMTLSSIKNTKKRKYKNSTKNLIREQPEKGGSELNIEVSTDVNDITCIAEDNTSPMRLRNRIKKGKRQNASLNLSQSKKKKVRKLDSEALTNNVTANKKNCEAQENSHTSSVLNDKIYKCLTCFEPFNCKKSLQEHYKLKHQPVVQQSNVDEFIAIHGTKFKCTKCEKVSNKKESAKYHVRRAHLYKNRPFLCKLCGKTFKEIHDIVLHARAHDQRTMYDRMSCSFKCGYTTTNPSHLKLHETRRHKKDYKFTCKKCGKGFIYKALLEEHDNIHTGHKPFVCDLCGVAYSINKYLTDHRLKVHSEISDLKGSKSWQCLHCPRLLNSKYALKEHLSKEHGIKTVYQCDTCGKTFLRNRYLTAHVKFTHEKIRPHICSICKKDFNSRSKMKRHETLHNGIKGQVCLTCGKSYTQSYALNLHITKKHGVEARTCEKCEKVFPTQFVFVKHKEICK